MKKLEVKEQDKIVISTYEFHRYVIGDIVEMKGALANGKFKVTEVCEQPDFHSVTLTLERITKEEAK